MKEISEKNIINGEECCWRCGMGRKSREIKEGWKCSGWGVTHKTHLWTVNNTKETCQAINQK